MVFDQIVDAVRETAVPSPEFVIGNHFGPNAKMDLFDYSMFFCFREGKTLQSDIEEFMLEYKPEVDPISRQAVSKQRMFIKPILFKAINCAYLSKIKYMEDYDSFNTLYDYIILAGDGSDYELPDFPEVRKEFGIVDTPKYRKPCMGKFSSIMDVLNGFLLDGIMGNYKQGELPLMHQNIKNIENMINPEKTIFTFDRNYGGMEMYARIIEMNSYFVIRLKDNFYKEERSKIKSKDSSIFLKLTPDRLDKFHDEELKEKYSKKDGINLRIVKIKLKNGEIETLLTNIPKKKMSWKQIRTIYKKRWGIETNYNTLKNRIYIEKYSSKKRIGITQDIYSKFILFNAFNYLKYVINRMINSKKRLQGIKEIYSVDQSNLIRNMKNNLLKILLHSSVEKKISTIKNFFKSCTRSPIKVKKNKTMPRKKKVRRMFNIQYSTT